MSAAARMAVSSTRCGVRCTATASVRPSVAPPTAACCMICQWSRTMWYRATNSGWPSSTPTRQSKGVYMKSCTSTISDSLSMDSASAWNCAKSSAFLTSRLKEPSGTFSTTGYRMSRSSRAIVRRLTRRVRGVATPWPCSSSAR